VRKKTSSFPEFLLGFLFCLPTLAVQAQKYYVWEYPVSGDFNDPNKWRHHEGNTTPVAGDVVEINAGSGYTVKCNGAAAGITQIGGDVILQLDGDFNAGNLGLGYGVVLRGAGTLTGTPALLGGNGFPDEYDVLVDGAGLTMNGLDLSSTVMITGRNGAKIISSGLTDRNGTRPLLESGAEWHHTGTNYGSLAIVNSGALLAADVVNFTRAQMEGGRLQTGQLFLGGLEATNGATLIATTATTTGFRPWVLGGGGTRMTVSGVLQGSTEDVQVLAGAVLSAGSLASPGNTFYVVDGSGSQLAVAAAIDRAIIAMRNQGRGSAASMTRSYLTIRDAGSVFNVVDRIVDAGVTVQNGARVNAVLGLGSGFSVDGVGSMVVLSGNLETSPSGLLAGVDVSGGGRLDNALANAGGSVFGAGSFWRVGNGLVVGDKEEVHLNLGDGGRVEVHGSAMAMGFSRDGKGNVFVDGGGPLPSPSVLDVRQVKETGVGVAGTGFLRVYNRGRILASKLTLGVEKDSDGTLEVDGAGTSLEMGDTLEIGRAGPGRMTILGGLVTAQDVLVGSNSETNVVRLAGSGSALTVAKALHVGETGSGRLTIEAGSRVEVTGDYNSGLRCEVAAKPGSTGIITVTGTGSTFVCETTSLVVGAAGAGTLNVTNGGLAEFPIIVIGNGPGASGVATISGAGSALHATARVLIGGTNSIAQGPGDVTVFNGGVLRADSTLNVYKPATLRLNGGGAIVGQTAEAAIPGTVLVANGGLFYLGGKLIGSVLVRPGGQLLPGTSPGRATVEGNVTFAEGSMLEMELGGTGAGTGFDQIEATGTVTLAGRLDFVFRDGFAPTNGQSFELVRGGAVSGSFSEVNVSGLAPGFAYTMANSGGNSLVLTATSSGVPTTAPVLSIARSANTNVVVSWPDYVTGWTLQQSPDLQSESWQPAAAPGNILTVPAPVGSAFFQLVKP
jgi:T5SS/PEP-CTERM-associated repeat protein